MKKILLLVSLLFITSANAKTITLACFKDDKLIFNAIVEHVYFENNKTIALDKEFSYLIDADCFAAYSNFKHKKYRTKAVNRSTA